MNNYTDNKNNCKISEKNKIALLICYFGPLPNYAELVFRSMGMNPNIDWIFISDREPEFPVSSNLKVRLTCLKDIQKLFSETFGFHVEIENPYSICSLRPAFGLCFADELKEYDFWGHADLDVIFGDVLHFLPDSILVSHDRILCRGHLSIYRNNDKVNNAFKLPTPGVLNYKNVFTNLSFKTHQFDEWPGIWKIMRYHRLRQYHEEFIADIKPPSRYRFGKFEAEQLQNYHHQFFYWHNGKTFQAYYHPEGGLFDREVAYIHFQKRHFPAPQFLPESVSGFTVGPLGFSPYNRENLSHEEIEKINPDRYKSVKLILQEQSLRFMRKWEKIKKILLD